MFLRMCIVHLHTAFLIVKNICSSDLSLYETKRIFRIFGNKYSSEKYEKNSPTSDNDPPCPRKNPTELISWQPRSVSTFRTRGGQNTSEENESIIFSELS